MSNKILKEPTLYDLTISKTLQKKIDILCSKVSTVEWSGVLFYRIKGKIGSKSFKVLAEDLLPLDIGTSGYTEFDVNPDVAGYMLDNDLLDCYTGIIHSHNTLEAFFSGTDSTTLETEGKKMNHFVSLIVNNAGNYVARITTHIKEEAKINSDISFRTYGDKKVKLGNKKSEKTSDYIIYNDLNIIKPVTTVSPLEKVIEEQLGGIRTAKAAIHVAPRIYSGYTPTVHAKSPWYKESPTSKTYKENYPENFKENTEASHPFVGQDIYGRQTTIPFEDFQSKEEAFDYPNMEVQIIPSVLESFCAQLLTLSPLSKKIVPGWVNNLDNTMMIRFGTELCYEDYMSSMLDIILTQTDIEAIKEVPQCEDLDAVTEVLQCQLALDAIDYLTDLNKNIKSKCVDSIISSLNKYA